MVDTKSEQVNIRLTPQDKARLKAQAEAEGESVSGWIEKAALYRLDEPEPSTRTDFPVDRSDCAHKRLPKPKAGKATSRCPDCGTTIELSGIERDGRPVSGLGGRLVP